MDKNRHAYSFGLLWFLCFCMACFFYVLHAGFWVDDAFITLRYAHNMLRGEGVVYNTNEFIEGYTSPLFVLLTASLGYWGVDLEIAARSISTISWILLCIAAPRVLQRLAPSNPVFPMVVFLITATSYPLVVWAASGMETTLYALLLFIGISRILLVKEEKISLRDGCITGGVFFMAYLARPEATIVWFIAVFYLLALSYHPKNVSLFKYAFWTTTSFLLLVFLHVLWRHHYYGDVLPNTYYAKLRGVKSADFYINGAQYVWGYVKSPPFLVAYALLGACLSLKKNDQIRIKMTWLFSIVMLYTIYIVAVGGDWMPASRFVVPLIPILGLMMGLSYSDRILRISKKRQFVLCIAAMLLSLSQAAYFHTEKQATYPLYWKAIAGHIHSHWPKESLIAINMAGYIPYLTPEHRYLDMLGLNDRSIAKQEAVLGGQRLSVGHFKGDGNYVLKRKPDYIIFQSGLEENITPASTFYQAEKQLLVSVEFKKQYRRQKVQLQLASPKGLKNNINFYYYQRIN